MKRPTFTLLAFYVSTTAAMTAALFTNSLVLMGIEDARAEQCLWMSAVVLGVLFAVAACQARRGRDARWYARCCLVMLYIVACCLFRPVLGLEPLPTPQLLLGGWALLLILAALNGLTYLVFYLVKRWS